MFVGCKVPDSELPCHVLNRNQPAALSFIFPISCEFLAARGPRHGRGVSLGSRCRSAPGAGCHGLHAPGAQTRGRGTTAAACGRVGTGVQVPPGPGDPGGSAAKWGRGCPGVSVGHREAAPGSACRSAAWPAPALPLYCHKSAVDLEGGPCSQELTALEASRKPAATRRSLHAWIRNVPPEDLVCVGCGPTERSARKTGQGSGVLPAAGPPPGSHRGPCLLQAPN